MPSTIDIPCPPQILEAASFHRADGSRVGFKTVPERLDLAFTAQMFQQCAKSFFRISVPGVAQTDIESDVVGKSWDVIAMDGKPDDVLLVNSLDQPRAVPPCTQQESAQLSVLGERVRHVRVHVVEIVFSLKDVFPQLVNLGVRFLAKEREPLRGLHGIRVFGL